MKFGDQIIPVDVGGTKVLVEARAAGGDQEIAGLGMPSFDQVQEAIRAIASAVTSSLVDGRQSKTTVEFGCEIAMEAGGLTALLVKGTGTAAIKVTLEWAAP